MRQGFATLLTIVVIIVSEIIGRAHDVPLVGRAALIGCLLGLLLAVGKLEVWVHQLRD